MRCTHNIGRRRTRYRTTARHRRRTSRHSLTHSPTARRCCRICTNRLHGRAARNGNRWPHGRTARNSTRCAPRRRTRRRPTAHNTIRNTRRCRRRFRLGRRSRNNIRCRRARCARVGCLGRECVHARDNRRNRDKAFAKISNQFFQTLHLSFWALYHFFHMAINTQFYSIQQFTAFFTQSPKRRTTERDCATSSVSAAGATVFADW